VVDVDATEERPGAAPVREGPQLLRPLRVRDFRLLFTGETISVLGDQFHFVALAWLTLQLTGSGLALGSVLMVAAIPRAVFMVFGGAFSDRWSPRSLMLYSNAIRAVLVAVIAALVLTNNAALWQLYLLAGAFGVVDAFFYPAATAIVPMLVDEANLPPANALMQGSQQLAGLVGPALAGVLVALVQTGPAFAIDAASFGVATLALFFVVGGRRAGRPQGVGGTAQEGVIASIRAGFAHAWHDRAIRSLIVLTAAFNLAFNGPLLVGIPFLADHTLGGGSATFGILLSAYGGGALVGAIGAGRPVRRLGTLVLGIAFAMGVALGLLGIAPNVAIAFGLLVAIGLGAGFLNVHIFSWLQARTAEGMRGRVMSLVMLGSVGLSPVSYALAGAFVDFGPVAFMFAAAGAIVVAASVVGFASGVAGTMTYAIDRDTPAAGT
jgi:MFS family permease